jgi:hypothetical protein
MTHLAQGWLCCCHQTCGSCTQTLPPTLLLLPLQQQAPPRPAPQLLQALQQVSRQPARLPLAACCPQQHCVSPCLLMPVPLLLQSAGCRFRAPVQYACWVVGTTQGPC